MANYIIIGGDDKEYGPVTDADVRQWIAEGRLSALSRAKAESDAEFRPLSAFPEFAAALGADSPPQIRSLKLPATADFLEHDYELDFGACIGRGWSVFKENFGALFLALLIVVLLGISMWLMWISVSSGFTRSLLHAPVTVRLGFSYFLSLGLSLIVGPLTGGLYLVSLKAIRGQSPSASDVFGGFQTAFLHLFLGALAMNAAIGLCMIPYNYIWLAKAGPVLEQLNQMQNGDLAGAQQASQQLMAAFAASLPALLITMLPVTFLKVSWVFTLPLVVDKKMDCWTAMKTSFKMVNRHWFMVFGLVVLMGLLNIAGVLVCGVGLLFTVPITIAALMSAYETIFCDQKY